MDRIYVAGRDEIPQKIALGAGESLRMTIVVLPGTSCSIPIDITLEGEGAEADVAGLYLCKGAEEVSLRVNLSHLSGGCTSRQLFKGLVGGSAHAAFDGLIHVRKDAQKTKAVQENHSILLSRSAVVSSQPQLEIYADDVECSHGATTGFLNADEQFYMRSRGIPEDEARKLQMISFVAPVLARLPESLKEEIISKL